MPKWIKLILLLVFSAPLVAETAQAPLGLEQAIINVLERSPYLQAADYESRAAASRIRQAQLAPAYRLSLALENFAGKNTRQGTDKLESSLSLSKVLELGDKSRLRGEVAQQQSLLLQNEQDAQRLDLLTETAHRFTEVATHQYRMQIAQNALDVLQDMQAVVKRRVSSGKAAKVELRNIQITLAQHKLELNHIKHQLDVAKLKLASLWGDQSIDFNKVKANLFAINATPQYATLLERLDSSPQLLSLVTQQRLAQSRLAMARARRSSDIALSAGVRHFNETDEHAFLFSMSIPLGTNNRAQSGVDYAQAMQQREPFLLQQRKLELQTHLYEAVQESLHASEAVELLQQNIIPAASLNLKDMRQGYRLGRYSIIELTQAHHALLDAQLEAVMSAAEYHRYQIEIDRITGAGLLTGVNP